jgi:hypothetical protein
MQQYAQDCTTHNPSPQVANRFHYAEGEFRARNSADILAVRNKAAELKAAKNER